jgi:site-specific DNA-methyltransferase (cytosine-N4-specific)
MRLMADLPSSKWSAAMIKENIHSRFTVPTPMPLSDGSDAVNLELKPYLQPFERELAMRELRSLIGINVNITERHGLWLANTNISDEFLRSRLTYWQRVGRSKLEPTLQIALEFTQKGYAQTVEQSELHRKRRLRYGPHDLHEYRGKFFPQLVRSLINISCIPKGSIVIDPMCGSGTTPCEAAVEGMIALGIDLNPLSSLISTIKSLIPTIDAHDFRENTNNCLSMFKFSKIAPRDIWDKDDLQYLKRWFAPAAIDDLASIVHELDQIQLPVYRDFFRVCLSNIIRPVSWQKDTDLRVRKDIQPYKKGTAHKWFLTESASQIERIYPYLCILNHKEVPTADIRKGNAVNAVAVFPEYQGKIDLLVTSPPYATALPYLDTDRLSLIVLGLLPHKKYKEVERDMVGTREISERERLEAWAIYETRRSELPHNISALIDRIAKANHDNDKIGFRRRNLPALLARYFLSMLDAMRSAHILMKPGAYGYYVVGNNSTFVKDKKIVIPTDNFLFDLGAAAGWHPVEKISMELIASRDIFRENRGSSESILCFKA